MKKDTKKNKKNLLIVGYILIMSGIILTTIGIMLGGFPGVKITKDGISSTTSDTRRVLPKTQLEDFTEPDVRLDSISYSADVVPKPSEDEHFYLEYTLNGDSDEPGYGYRRTHPDI